MDRSQYIFSHYFVPMEITDSVGPQTLNNKSHVITVKEIFCDSIFLFAKCSFLPQPGEMSHVSVTQP